MLGANGAIQIDNGTLDGVLAAVNAVLLVMATVGSVHGQWDVWRWRRIAQDRFAGQLETGANQ